ncbi:MAG: 5-(carboxyamino)imidazole ribonucleotide mutase [Magnetococcales bacterium]|nr:5-(carboxyamino)imidazole ribonucleotide mutase [Magnetococcales bacterium]MBF0437944.1 5-(carboxyamino)imidazole ribonucleotide mutase [Magnetococcales bacterium]
MNTHIDLNPLVGILMGSDSDWEVMKEAGKVLREFDIPFEMTVTSAHRTPERTHAYATSAAERGVRVLIVGAGAAAHLAGVVAAISDLPVIGVPLAATELQGMDALLSTVQMPGGIPVATMAIGKAGAKNGALFAVRILALQEDAIRKKMILYKAKMANEVDAKHAALQTRVQDL